MASRAIWCCLVLRDRSQVIITIGFDLNGRSEAGLVASFGFICAVVAGFTDCGFICFNRL